MEMAERRRRADSTKASNRPGRGGKGAERLTEEEEARRREAVRHRLREKLELERRALKVVERLLEDRVDQDLLVDCAKFITPANYKDAVEERSITKLCGYPICPNKLGKIPTQQYKISTKTNKVYDITERKCFCSNFCYKASKDFELQISKTPLWLRQEESPPEIKLMNKGDGGSSGEEVFLSERFLQVKDIENPLPAPPIEPLSSQQQRSEGGHSDSSDIEQEHEFVSSVVSQRQGPRVHWGDLPKHTDGEKKETQGKMQRIKTFNGEGDKEGIEQSQSQNTEIRAGQLHVKNSALTPQEEKDLPEDPTVEETTSKIQTCSLSQTVTHNVSLPVSAYLQAGDITPLSSPLIDSNPSAESKHLPSSIVTKTDQGSHIATIPTQPGLNITQVGMSKKGAAGLRDLLKDHTSGPKSDSIRLNLLECLRKTFKEWSTHETMKFLYGADYSLDSPFADVMEEKDKEEELDEDDLEDEVTVEACEGADADVKKRLSAAAPDFGTLRKETQELELRVREFYKGTWILPEESKVTVQHQVTKDPVLPLVDSNAQHLIQRRIAVEKLTNCLRNIVGPLHLTMTDISTDLNNLIRTFRFTNTNIIHKTPEWTLIAVVLLHLLSQVSPVVQKAVETATSVDYLNTLMKELSLQEQDLLNLVQLFKTPKH